MNLNQKGFTVVEGLLIAVLISVVGFAGYYVWNENQDSNTGNSNNQISSDEQNLSEENEEMLFCATGEDLTAASGQFCSNKLGIEVSVPEYFAGKLQEGSRSQGVSSSSTSFADSGTVDSSTAYYYEETENSDSVSFSISEYPLTSLWFKSWGLPVINPEKSISVDTDDPELDETKFDNLDGHKLYEAGIGDAGTYETYKYFIRDDKVYVVSYKSQSSLTGVGEQGTELSRRLENKDSSFEIISIK